MGKKIKTLTLFSNVGVGETYLEELGIETVVANELLKNRVEFYSHLYPKTNMVCGSITDDDVFNKIISLAKKEKVKLIIATPPCQGMSVAGHMKEDDPRNTLIIKAMEAFNILSPDYMLIENVPQMLKTSILFNGKPINIQDFIIQEVGQDYNVICKVYDAADYGTPQYRKRTIVRIYKKGLVWDEPKKRTHINVKEVIGDLPSLDAGQDSGIKWHKAKPHNKNHILWLSHTPTGKTAFENEIHFPKKDGRRIRGFSTTYKRMNWDKPAPTVTMANGSISSQNNVHPGKLMDNGLYSDARVLTPLELFRVMGLPDDWNVPSNVSENILRHVVGEAVPPLFMKAMLLGITKN